MIGGDGSDPTEGVYQPLQGMTPPPIDLSIDVPRGPKAGAVRRQRSIESLPLKVHIHERDYSGLTHLEEIVRTNDPNTNGASLQGGFILFTITETPELLRAAGCEAKADYLRAAPDRLGIEKSTAYDWLTKAKLYYRYRELFERYGLDLESNPDFFLTGGHASKLHLLDVAMKRCVPKPKGGTSS